MSMPRSHTYLVKMVVKHITNTEYYPVYEQLLQKIEVTRIAKRVAGNGNLLESEEVDREDWEQRHVNKNTFIGKQC
jgi:hypothetical protein